MFLAMYISRFFGFIRRHARIVEPHGVSRHLLCSNENSYLELDVVLRVKEARNAIANKNS